MALPGVKTIIKDRFYSISRQDIPVGPRVCLIAKRGTADGTGNVKDLDVVQATTEQDVITAFGEDSQVHRGFFELLAGGAERVYIVPIPSDASYNHSTGTITSATHPGVDVFDAAFTAAEASSPDIIVPWGRGGHPNDWQGTATIGDDEEYGFYADNASSAASWAYKVAVRVKEIAENSHPCFAVMGIKPWNPLTSNSEVMTPSQVGSHVGSSGLADLIDRDGEVMAEVGRHVAVIATELKPVNYKTAWGYANGAFQEWHLLLHQLTKLLTTLHQLDTTQQEHNSLIFQTMVLTVSHLTSIRSQHLLKALQWHQPHLITQESQL
jgi:hypothetical protein